jgi:hypothetical protein
LTFDYGQTFLHGAELPTRDDIPRTIREIRVETGR